MPRQVVRVAVSNNFNCTPEEWAQLETFKDSNPAKEFFINCNIKTPLLSTITEHSYRVVITANPDLFALDIDRIINKLKSVQGRLAFVRVKYIPDSPAILGLIERVMDEGIPVVITVQRFNGKESMTRYADPDHYKRSYSRYRLAGVAKLQLTQIVRAAQASGLPVWICDEKGKGCGACKLCSTLTVYEEIDIASLNLSSSGVCPYNCPDCYAKTMQKFVTACGHRPMAYDKIKKNMKQAGKTGHIKSHKTKKGA